MGWSIYVTLDRPIDRPALGALLHALCAAHPDLLGHGGALGFNEQEWGWSLAVNVAPYDKADRTSTLIQLSGAFAVSGDKAVRFAMLLGEQLVAGGWSPTFKSSDFAISEKVVTAIARVVGLEKLVSRGFNYRCSCGGRLKAKVRSTPAVVAQVTAIIDGVWNKEHAGLGHKTRPGFRAAAVVLAMLIALLGGVPLAIAEKDPCYAACYRKAAPCIGRDACNRKSSGCYDRCDSARSAARDRPPLVCGRARAKVSAPSS